MTDGVSSEPVIAPLPTPISVEPRTAPPAEAAEIARQAEEAKLPTGKGKEEPKVAAKVEEKAKPLSTRDAIRAAAAKVNAEPAAEKASPLKADPAVKDAPAAAVVKDAKAAEPVRGEDGKFVSTKATEPAAKAAEPAPAKVDGAKAAEPDAPVKAAEPVKPSFTADPPPKRFSKEAQDEWAAAPEKVRAEVARMEKELVAGFEKHRAAAARDADLAEFHEMAAKGGTDVKTALGKYVNMEQVLSADPVKGLELIAQNVGMSLKDVAAKILNQTPDVAASQQDATIRELRDHIARLEKSVGTVTQTFQKQQTDSTTEAVTKFAADHPRFDELSEDIAFFLKTRTKDLAEAYSYAERLNPAPAAPIPAAPASSAAPVVTLVPPSSTTTVPASTAGQKSIAGAPTAGSDPVRKQPSSSIREALRRAQSRAG